MERTCDISPEEPSDGGFLVEPAPRPDRAIIVAGTALLIVGFLGILIGEFGCSVGRIGVLCWIAGSLGIFFAGLCFLCFAVFMFRHMVRKAAGQRILTKENVRGAAVELGVIFLNVLIYGGCAIIALGALTAMDSAPFIALPVIAFAILGFASYRIYRKRHPFPTNTRRRPGWSWSSPSWASSWCPSGWRTPQAGSRIWQRDRRPPSSSCSTSMSTGPPDAMPASARPTTSRGSASGRSGISRSS